MRPERKASRCAWDQTTKDGKVSGAVSSESFRSRSGYPGRGQGSSDAFASGARKDANFAAESAGVRHRPARHSAHAPRVCWPDLVLDRSGSGSMAQEHEQAHGHWWQCWPPGTWFDTRPPCHPGACQAWRGRTPPPLRTWLLEVRARTARRAASAELRRHPGHDR